MRYCLNTFLILFFFTARAIGSDELSQSVDMTFTLNIEPHVCKLQEQVKSIDFGKFQVFDIVTGAVTGEAMFKFTDCQNVNDVTISFSGVYVDKEHNFIRNKPGGEHASGVAISLYGKDGNRIQLKDGKKIDFDTSPAGFDFIIKAAVEKEHVGAVVTTGIIDTSVNLNVIYN
ncbi:TPA: fimbrial protein [Escherichia coli]